MSLFNHCEEPTSFFGFENQWAQHFLIWVIFWISIWKLSCVLRGEIDVSLENNFWLIEYFELLFPNIAKMMKNHFCMCLCSNLTHCVIGALTCIFIIIHMHWNFWDVLNYDNKEDILARYMGQTFKKIRFWCFMPNSGITLKSNQTNYFF